MRLTAATGSLTRQNGGISAFIQTMKVLSALPTFCQLLAFVAPDDTERLDFCRQIPEIQVISQSPAGFSQRRNALIRQAEGEWIVFLEEGCLPAPNWLTCLEAASVDVPLGAADLPLFDPSSMAGPINNPAIFDSAPFYLPLAASAVRKSALALAGAYDEAIDDPALSQLDFCRRLSDAHIGCQRLPTGVFPSLGGAEIIPVSCTWKEWYETWVLIHAGSSSTPLQASLHTALHVLSSPAARISMFGSDPAFLPSYSADTEDALDSALRRAQVSWRKLYFPPPPPKLVQDSRYPSRKPLVICMLSQEYPPGVVGGIGRMTAELAHGFVKQGHCVHVITRSRQDSPAIRFDEGVFVHSVSPYPNGEPPEGVRMPEHLWRYSRAAADRIQWITERSPLNIVDAPLWDAEGLAAILDRRWTCITNLETPLQVMLNLNPEWLQNEDSRRTLEALLAAEKNALLESDGIRAISGAILQTVQSGYDVDLSVRQHAILPIGIRDAPAKPSEKAKETVEVLFVGRFERRKGIDGLLKVIPSLCREFPFLRFTLAGSDKEIISEDGKNRTAVFESKHAENPILRQISFAGPVNDDELATLYRHCDIFVAPSLYESFGIVYLEAMRAGKPVVGCRVGGVPEIVQDGVSGLLCEPGDTSGLRAAIAALINDPSLRARMGHAGRAIFEERFTTEKVVQRTIEFYYSVLSSRDDAAQAALNTGACGRTCPKTLL